jgi:putative nucleotidyltransferase with HDIG domain
MRINLFALLKSISDAQDLVSPLLSNHHQQVAYLSYRLANKLGLSIEVQRDIFLAGLVHDIGALSSKKRLEFIEAEPMDINNHAFIGAKMLRECNPMQNLALIIKYHHLPWNNGEGICQNGEKVSFGSHVIHLADRVCTMIKKDENVLTQIPQIIENIKTNSNTLFVANIVKALEKLSIEEYTWLDLMSSYPVDKIDVNQFHMAELDIDDVIEITLLFSHIIDFRSRFTARHSAGVANTASRLAKLAGFPEMECKMMLVAGYLHDLGKLVISNDILEKQGKLTVNEFNVMRSHTYYTYQLLDSIPDFDQIKEWAAYHHERLDGSGYPFHIKGEGLSTGARIMAVADVFTAITEDRPYRVGMSDEQSIKVLTNMVMNNALDERIVNILTDNYQEIKELREKSQQDATQKYESFLKE